MKKLRLIVPVLIISLLLSGCGFFLPFFYLNLSSSAQEDVQETLPIGSDVDPKLSAEDIYWRSKYAASKRAIQYSEQATIRLSFIEDEDYWTDLHYDEYVTLDPDQSAVNVQTLVSYDYEEPAEYWEYYRDEDGQLAYYFHEVDTGYCSREEIPLDGGTPYAIILDYSVYGYPYDPEDMTLEPQTRILDDREVYVLTYRTPATNILGYTGNTYWDNEFAKRQLTVTWYVDTQTHLPVREECSILQIDDLIGEYITSYYPVDNTEPGIAITAFTITMDYQSFEPVELPDIPEQVRKEAWNNAGFSDN